MDEVDKKYKEVVDSVNTTVSRRKNICYSQLL